MPPTRIAELETLADGTEVTLMGWVQFLKKKGKIAFMTLRDPSGTCQVVLFRPDIGDVLFRELTSAHRESVVSITGILKLDAQAKAGLEVGLTRGEVVSTAAAPLPLGVIDDIESDLDTRLNNRFLDLRTDQGQRIFRIRATMQQGIRRYLDGLGLIEVNTPKLVAAGAEGGATLFEVRYFERTAYLAQSPQLYKQILMAAGFPGIYEIAPAFRAEPSDTGRHVAEFISLDVEVPFIDSSADVMIIAEGIVLAGIREVRDRHANDLEAMEVIIPLPTLPVPRITHAECLAMLAEVDHACVASGDIDTDGEKTLGRLVKEQHGSDLFFITHFPTALKEGTFYAMRLDEDPSLTGYFDLIYAGLEIVSGGQREHRIERLVPQLEGIGLAQEDFADYLAAFRYGMPPHGGFGLGIDRLTQKLLGQTNIREAILFPRDLNRITP